MADNRKPIADNPSTAAIKAAVSVRQDTPARADAVAWLSAEANGKSIAHEFEFGLLRDRPNGDIAFPDDEDGEWGVMAKIAWDVRYAIRES